MGHPRFEVATGATDGVNKTFIVSAPYVSNTTAVFLNGKLYRRDWDDGWVETSPAMGIVTLLEAPLPADVVQIFFTDAEVSGAESEVSTLQGRLVEIGKVYGVLLDAEMRLGSIDEFGVVDGRLIDPQTLLGSLEDSQVLRAQLHEVCD